MRGDEHYRESERLIALVETGEYMDTSMPGDGREVIASLLLLAQVHATLANAGALIDASAASESGVFIGIPSPSEPELGDRPYRGTPWGRAFYGDRHLITNDKDS